VKVYYPDHILDDEVFQIILSTCNSALLDSLETPDRFNKRARTIGSNIYDMTAIPTNKISKDCISAILEKRQATVTKEHFHGRQQGGEEILNYVKKQRKKKLKLDPLVIKDIVDKYRQVHFTSKEENQRLANLAKKHPNLQSDWESMYRYERIHLIDYVKHQRYDKYKLT